jgi:CheY-like chemotaxis protein
MEILVTDAEVERRISAGESTERISDAARRAGMRTMWDSGVEHVLTGETDIDELLRVLEVPQESEQGRAQARVAHPTPGARSATPSSNAVVRPPSRPPSFLPDEVLELVDDTGTSRRDKQQTILLVEDEDQLRLVLRDLLEREGFTVVEAIDGVHALDAIDRDAPDAIVLDLNLPRLDGYQVLNHIRARNATATIPVLVLTAHGDEESEVKVFQSGANDFIAKPFRPRALSARLKALMQKS